MNVISDQNYQHHPRYFARWNRWVPQWTPDWRKAMKFEGNDAVLDLAKLRGCGHRGKLVSIRQLEKAEE